MAVEIAELTVADPPEAWRAGGFSVDDDSTCRVGPIPIRLVGREHGKRIVGWSLRDTPAGSLDSGALDGLPTTAAETPPAEPAEHANGCTLIDHVVVFSPDLDRTVEAMGTVDLEPRGTRDSDTYGSPMRQVFYRLGPTILEVVGAPDSHGEGPAGFFGLAHTVVDLDATAALLAPAMGDVKDAVQPGRRIATLRHKEIGMSVATAFMSPEPG